MFTVDIKQQININNDRCRSKILSRLCRSIGLSEFSLGSCCLWVSDTPVAEWWSTGQLIWRSLVQFPHRWRYFQCKQGSITHSLLLKCSYCPDMSEILLKRMQILHFWLMGYNQTCNAALVNRKLPLLHHKQVQCFWSYLVMQPTPPHKFHTCSILYCC